MKKQLAAALAGGMILAACQTTDAYTRETKTSNATKGAGPPLRIWSPRATRALLDAGFSAVTNLTGGMIAWNEAGYSITKDPKETTNE